MSYLKCKGISRKGNKIEVNVASSNCFPITYSKSEYKQRENQETLFWLYVDIEFKKALDEKEDNTLYTLYSDTYKYIKLKGSNGAFYYGYSSAVEKGKYKEMYVKAKIVGRDIQVKRAVLTDKEIQKELKNEQLKEQAKERIKNVEQVKKDLVEFKNDRFDIDKYYLQEICRLFNIKEYRNTKKITIPKNLIHIERNGYSFTGKHSRKMSAKIDYIRGELLKVVE